MENKIKPEASAAPPRPTSYEERLRQQRAAAKAKLEKPATPAPAPIEEAEDAFYEEYSEYDDFSFFELFENWKSKFKNPFKNIKFTFPKIFKKPSFSLPKTFKKPSFSLPKIFKKKSDKKEADTIAKEEAPIMEKSSGKFKKACNWFNRKLDALCKSLLFGIVVAIILNVIAKYFWPELPTKIPTVYSFFNGFLTVAEFIYKTALGGIAAIFKGTFGEFSNGVNTEVKEMWNAFCAWMSSIRF